MFSSFFYCACDLIKKKQFIVSIWAGCTYLHWISSGKGLTKDNPPQPHNNIWLPFGLCIFPTLFSLRLHECPLKFWLRYGLAGLKRRMNLWQGVHFQCCCPHGHKTVPLLFVNCVSSPPGLPYSFFQHFFFLTELEHIPAKMVLKNLNLKSYYKWFSSLILHSFWFCVICPECKCSPRKWKFLVI